MNEITPCLWFDTDGEEAANFYVSVFPNSRIVDVTRYGAAGPRPEGMVMTVSFELDGRKFVALNGGPDYTFSEAISFQVSCKDQEEVDAFWSKLSEGGEEGPCGWLKDRYGVSWQIVPTALHELLADPDPERSQRVMQAMLEMKKIEIDALERAAGAVPTRRGAERANPKGARDAQGDRERVHEPRRSGAGPRRRRRGHIRRLRARRLAHALHGGRARAAVGAR